ncbi:MAG: GspMb/PilO family protein [Acidobacteriota bacterium]
MNRALLVRIVREKRLIIVPLSVVFLANVALAAFLVYPLSLRVATGLQQEEQARLVLRAAELEKASTATMAADKAAAERDLEQFYGVVLPQGLSGARKSTYLHLAQLARDAGLNYQRRLEDAQAPKSGEVGSQGPLTRFEITMVLEGDYAGVRQFLQDVETSTPFIVIDNITLVEGAEPNSDLVLTVVLSTYFRNDGDGQ